MMRFAILAAGLLAGSAMAQDTSAQMVTPKLPSGYLSGEAALSVVKLLPPPPAPNTATEIADRYVYAVSASGVGGAQWQAAIEQLSISSPSFRKALACAIGKAPGPATEKLLARAAADFVPPMSAAKAQFNRDRPFTRDKGPACDPNAADGIGAALGKSYPSGHAGIGWLWGLILADALPARAEAVRAFGKSTGDLRLVCRVHWLSDVENGRILATSLYQKQSETGAFKADLAAAQAELAAAAVLDCK